VTDFADGRSVYCREPAGTVFELHEAPPDDAIAEMGGDAT
jgi:hypothetical protein